jgi:hypothetical protein
MLTDAQRAELEKLGPDYVRSKVIAYAGGHTGRLSMIAFDAGEMRCGDIEDWLTETSTKESAKNAKERATILKWAKIAAWAVIVGACAAITGVVATIFVALIK